MGDETQPGQQPYAQQPYPQQQPYAQQPAPPQVPTGQPQYTAPELLPHYMQPRHTPLQPTGGLTGQTPPPPQAAMYSPYAYQQMGVRPPMSRMAVWAFISSFFIGILGVVLGLIASKQIGNRGLRGVGFAMAGFYIGIFVTVIQFTLGTIVAIALGVGAAAL